MTNQASGSGSVRERFEDHLSEYGTLWRALAAADKKKARSAAAGTAPSSEVPSATSNGRNCSSEESTNDNNAVDQDYSEVQLHTPSRSTSSSLSPGPSQKTLSSNIPSLLPAILGGKAISLRVPQNHDESCAVLGCVGECAEPIFEDETGTATGDGAKDNKFIQDGDDDEDDDDDDVVVVDASFSASRSTRSNDDGEPSDEPNDDNHKSTSASVSSTSSSSVAIPRRPRRNARRTIASASGWRRRPDGILSSSDDDSFDHDTTSEEEWIDGDDGDIDGDTDDGNKARSASAGSFATPATCTTPKATTKDALKEEEQDDDDVIIILSDDDEEEDINSATSESIGGDGFSSEYLEDSFVVSDGIGSSSSSNGSSSSDDDVQIVSPTKKKISKAITADAVPRGREKPATQPPKTQKTKPKPKAKQSTNKKSATSYQDVSRTTFARKREQYTKSTFAEFNTKVFSGSLSSVEVVWSKRLKTTAGLTRLKRIGTSDSMRRIATIELSTKILDNLERLRATLLHEMCHAAGWLVDGVHKPPHGKVFKKWANLSMRRIRDVEVTTTHDYIIRFKFAWKCQNTACGSVIKRHSRSVDPNKHCCGSCKGRLMEIEVPGSKNDIETVGHTPKKKRAPTGFSLFVQQNSKAVRERLVAERGSSVTQPEVMKECGRIWRLKKEGLEKNTGNGNGGSKSDETNDENLPYDLNRAINDMENRLNGLTM